MYIKIFDSENYLSCGIKPTPVISQIKTFFRCSDLKKNGDETTFFISDTLGSKLSSHDGKNLTFSKISNLYITERNNILTTKIAGYVYTITIDKNKICLKKGLHDNQVFEIEYTYIDVEPLGYGSYGFICKDPKILCNDCCCKNGEKEVGKILFDNDFEVSANRRIQNIYSVLEYFNDDMINAKKFMLLPKKLCNTNIKYGWGYSTLQLIYDYGLNSKCISEKNEKMNDKESFLPYKNILQAIIYLNKKGLVHLDVKCENVVMDEKDGLYKLIDLDFVGENFHKNSIFFFNITSSPLLYMLSYVEINNEEAITSAFKLKNLVTNFQKSTERNVNKMFKNYPKIMNKILNQYFLECENDDTFAVEWYNTPLFKKFESYNISKKDLFLRHDLYGFCISMCIMGHNRNCDFNLFLEMIDLFIIQKEHTPTYDEILETFDRFIESL